MPVRSVRISILSGALMALGLAQSTVPALAEDRALIIGINSYPRLPDNKQLTGSVNDARLMERVAREVWRFAPNQIKVLLNEHATSHAIRAEIESWLVAGTQPGDRVLLTYAGHGYYSRSGNPNEPDGIDETLAPSDIVPVGGSYDNMILDDEIDTALRRLEGRDVMMIVDACHSGTITRSFDPSSLNGPSISRSLDRGRSTRGLDGPEARIVTETEYGRLRSRKVLINPHKHVLAWSAVSSTELAYEDMELGDAERLGVFTRRFAEELLERRAASGETAQDSISVASLLEHVRRRTYEYCQIFSCGTGMTPSIEAPAAMLSRDLLNWRPRGEEMAGGSAPAVASSRVRPDDYFPPARASGVRVEIVDRAQVRVGETIKLRVSSERDGWLIVLDVREDGRVVQLFPSTCARKERFIKAGATLTLPDATYGCEFAANEPGSGQILAIVTEDNVSLDALLGRHRDLEIVPEPVNYLAEIAQQLLKVWTGDSRNRPARWGLGAIGYEVRTNLD